MADTPRSNSIEIGIRPPTGGASAVFMWAADPDLKKSLPPNFWHDCKRAIGFYERSKYVCLKAFLESSVTVKDLQLRLGLRRPAAVTKMLFGYSIREARTGAMIDAFEDGLDAVIDMRLQPVSSIDPEYRHAVLLPTKVFTSATLTDDEVQYLLSGKKLYWYWRGERPTFAD